MNRKSFEPRILDLKNENNAKITSPNIDKLVDVALTRGGIANVVLKD